MIRTKKRILSLLLATVMLLGIVPMTAFAADITMDLDKCEVSAEYVLTDEEGQAFSAGYGLKKEDNPFGYAVKPLARKMHDYTAKRPGLTSDKSKWVYGQDY